MAAAPGQAICSRNGCRSTGFPIAPAIETNLDRDFINNHLHSAIEHESGRFTFAGHAGKSTLETTTCRPEQGLSEDTPPSPLPGFCSSRMRGPLQTDVLLEGSRQIANGIKGCLDPDRILSPFIVMIVLTD
jgi:hypothetical protein